MSSGIFPIRPLVALLVLGLALLACEPALEFTQLQSEDDPPAENPTPTQPHEVGPPVNPGGPADGRLAALTFTTEDGVFTGDGEPGWLLTGCWPPNHNDNGQGYLNVADDGTLSGACANTSGTVTVEGSVTGFYDAGSQTVTFELITTSRRQADEGNGTALVTLRFNGTGPVVDGHSSGLAAFVYTCGASGEGIACAHGQPTHTVSGTVPFGFALDP